MAGCISELTMSEQTAPPPERTLITSRREYVDAVTRVLGLARHEIRIFDPDLADIGLNNEQATRVLHQFFVRSRTQRLFIAVHDTGFVAKRAPHLMRLLGTFSGNMLIHKTQGDAARVQDCFALADEEHFVRRKVAQQPRGAVYLNDPKEARGMRERFDEIWESSYLAVSASTVGL